MVYQQRKPRPPKSPEFSPDHLASTEEEKNGPVLAAANDAAFEKKYGEMPPEIRKLRSDRIRRFQHNVNMFNSFRVIFRRELSGLGKAPEIAVANPRLHAEASFAFKNIRAARVRYFVGTRQEEEHYKRLGMEAEKVDPELQLLDAPVGILIALYEGANATWRLARNVELNGWLICRGEVAQELLETGHFKQMGTLDAQGGILMRSEKNKEPLRWEEAVRDDPEFKTASKKIDPEGRIATYEGAIAMLEATGRYTGEKSGNVLDNVKAFLRDVLDGKILYATVDRESDTITFKTPEMKKSLEIGIDLPVSKMNLDKIVVLKKKREGEA